MTDATNTPNVGEVRDFTFEGTRGLRYVELFAVGPEWITVYNSIGLSDGPPELWDATDPKAAAEQLGVGTVVKNGPHWWMSDRLTLRFSVEQTTVGGIGYRIAARLPAFIAKSGGVEPPAYTVLEANKQGTNVYRAGELVYELVAPNGDAFVLQSTNIPPDELTMPGHRLTPAEGWRFQTAHRTIIRPVQPNDEFDADFLLQLNEVEEWSAHPRTAALQGSSSARTAFRPTLADG